jgi:zinc protease
VKRALLALLIGASACAAGAGHQPAAVTPPQTPDAPFRTSAPEPEQAARFVPGRVRSLLLGNGIHVFAYARPGELTAVRLSFLVPPSTPIREWRTALPMWHEIVRAGGATSLPPSDLRRRLLADGALIRSSMTRPVVSLELLGRGSSLDDSLDLLASIVTGPLFEEREIDFRKRMRATWLADAAGRPAWVGDSVQHELVFGIEHLYGGSLGEREEDVRAITRQELVRSYESLRNPATMVIGVAGAYDDVELRPTLERLFGSLPPAKERAATAPVPQPVPPATRRLVLVDRPLATTSIIRVGGALPSVHGTEEFAGLVLNQVLGTTGYGRLDDRLDKELALTDSVDMSYWHDSLASEMTIEASVPAARTGEALRAIQDIVASIGRDGVAPAELERAKSRIVAQQAGSFERVSDIAWALVAIYALGDDPQQRIQSYEDRIMAITSDDVRRFAARMLPADRLTTVVVGDTKALRGPLERNGQPITETRNAVGQR